MENLLRGIPKAAVYLDDILITGSDDAKRLDHLSDYLAECCRQDYIYKRHMQVHINICITFAPISQKCIKLWAYLSLVNYCNTFMPKRSTELSSLYKLVQKGTP